LPLASVCREAVVIRRPVDVVRHVLLSRVHDLDRSLDLAGRPARLVRRSRSRAGARSRRRSCGCARPPSRAAAPSLSQAVLWARASTCEPTQTSHLSGSTWTVQARGSMVACARSGSSYSASRRSPSRSPLAMSPT
jgi:hypothetical protein